MRAVFGLVGNFDIDNSLTLFSQSNTKTVAITPHTGAVHDVIGILSP